MFKAINGWTKKKMKAKIRKKNDGTRAISPNPSLCAYETRSGNRCAVGVFLPDDHVALIEWSPIRKVVRLYPGLYTILPLDLEGMSILQNIHDSYSGDSDMRDILCNWVDGNVEDAQ